MKIRKCYSTLITCEPWLPSGYQKARWLRGGFKCCPSPPRAGGTGKG